MKIKDIPKEELETMGYDEIAYIILSSSGKKMKLLDLFKNVCKALSLPENTVEDRISDFFELLSINKKFVLLPNGYWDLAVNHVQNIVIEDEEDIEDSIEEDDEANEEDISEEEDNYYDDDLEDVDDTSDELDDLVIIDEEDIDN